MLRAEVGCPNPGTMIKMRGSMIRRRTNLIKATDVGIKSGWCTQRLDTTLEKNHARKKGKRYPRRHQGTVIWFSMFKYFKQWGDIVLF